MKIINNDKLLNVLEFLANGFLGSVIYGVFYKNLLEILIYAAISLVCTIIRFLGIYRRLNILKLELGEGMINSLMKKIIILEIFKKIAVANVVASLLSLIFKQPSLGLMFFIIAIITVFFYAYLYYIFEQEYPI